MKNRIFIYTLLILIISTCACSPEEEHENEENPENPISKKGLSLSADQIRLAALETATVQYRHVSESIACTGEIDIPPQSMASVSAPLGGFIHKSSVIPGTYVKKGQILAFLTNPQYITLQQEYLSNLSELKYAKQDYERQQILGEQNATAAKNLQQSEATYKSLQGKVAGLKAQLQLIGVGINSLEEGNIQSVVGLRAPISGFVTAVNHHLGQFAEGKEVIFEVVNQDNLILELKVFEQDIAKVENGQKVVFKPLGAVASYEGEIFLISPKRNNEDRTFSVHASFAHDDHQLKPGMFVEAQIMLSNDEKAALPEQAVVYSGNEPFVVIQENQSYRLKKVEVGNKSNGWVELINAEEIADKKIVTEGASRIFAALTRD